MGYGSQLEGATMSWSQVPLDILGLYDEFQELAGRLAVVEESGLDISNPVVNLLDDDCCGDEVFQFAEVNPNVARLFC